MRIIDADALRTAQNVIAKDVARIAELQDELAVAKRLNSRWMDERTEALIRAERAEAEADKWERVARVVYESPIRWYSLDEYLSRAEADFATDQQRIGELQEELADRKLRRERDRERLEQAEAERDSLRCCANCRASGENGDGICGEEEYEAAHATELTDALPVIPAASCTFTPSRWEARP